MQVKKWPLHHYLQDRRGKKTGGHIWERWDSCGTTQVLLRELPPHDNEKIVTENLDQKGYESESSHDNEHGD